MHEQAYVLSDLHLGDALGEPELDGFKEDSKLATFIRSIAIPGVTLFINGDFIDYPQVPPYEVTEAQHLLWDENTSLAKTRAVISAHSEVFIALKEFISENGVLRINVGNHDLDLAWPMVRDHLRKHLGDPSDKSLQFSLLSSVYHGVHIEHGHRLTLENATRDPESFIHEWPVGSGRYYLERVWGTDFMLGYYNALERKYPFADSVKPMRLALYYGLKNRWIGAHELVRFVRFLLHYSLPVSSGFPAVLIDEQPDYTHICRVFKTTEWQSMLAERLTETEFDEDLQQAIEKLSSTEKAALLKGDLNFLDDSTQIERNGPAITLWPFETREVQGAKELLKGNISHVVFGHTHEIVDGALDNTVFNPGTWLPRLDLESAAVQARMKKSGLTLEMLGDSSMYATARKAVHIEPNTPQARVRLVDVE